MAGKSDNPAQVMPRAIAGTLIGATLLSVLAQVRESAHFNAATASLKSKSHAALLVRSFRSRCYAQVKNLNPSVQLQNLNTFRSASNPCVSFSRDGCPGLRLNFLQLGIAVLSFDILHVRA